MSLLKNWIIVVPARLGSTRLNKKPLQDLGGLPLIARVYQRLLPLKKEGAKIVVATDSLEVSEACQKHEVESQLTSSEHQSGTDRVYEVASKHPQKYILNVQGDEPFIEIQDLLTLMKCMENSAHKMGTLVYNNSSIEDYQNPNVVKVVTDQSKKALYFSRSPIPYYRDHDFQSFWQHQGVYAYSQDALSHFCSLPSSSLESLEKLEQLRALQAGIDILTVEASKPSLGIDTPEDLEHARKRITTT